MILGLASVCCVAGAGRAGQLSLRPANFTSWSDSKQPQPRALRKSAARKQALSCLI